MSSETLLMIIAGIAAMLFALYELFCILIAKGKTAKAEGTAVDIQIIDQGRCKGYRARFAYQINGTMYTSENSLKIPMQARMGYKTEVRYFVEHPQRLFYHSVRRMSVGVAVAMACMLLAFYYR